MGWDTVTYKGHYELFRDTDLLTLRHFFLEELKTFDSKVPDVVALKEFFEKWEFFGVGVVIGIDPEAYIQGSCDRLTILISLFDRTIERLRGFGATIPLAYLNIYFNDEFLYFKKDLPTEPLISAILRYRKLLDPRDPV